MYPAAYNHLATSVTGIDCQGATPDLPHGSWHDLCAPSAYIVTTRVEGDYAGTSASAPARSSFSSFAAPLASSVAALLLGVNLTSNENLTNDDLVAIMKKGARDLGPAGMDPEYGYGLLRADSAVALISPPNDVVGGEEDSFTATYIGQRQQEFRRIPGVNNDDEQWRTCWVKVYQVDVSASFD